MYRLFAFAGVLALAVGFAATAEDKKKEDKTPDIETIMKKAHDSDDGLRVKLKEAAKEKKWDDAKKLTDEWVKLAAALGKNKPPMGSAESWKKMTADYEKQVKSLATAVKEKKVDDLVATDKKIACVACHKAHKKD